MIIQMTIILIIYGVAAFSFGFAIACFMSANAEVDKAMPDSRPEGFKLKSLTEDNDHLKGEFR